jgi:hypothetical protein
LKFPGCEIVLRVDRDLTDPDGNVVLSDTRLFLTSQNPDVVRSDQLLSQVRAHWQIENCIFHIKDRCWHEDQHWTARPGLSEWLARLTKWRRWFCGCLASATPSCRFALAATWFNGVPKSGWNCWG